MEVSAPLPPAGSKSIVIVCRDRLDTTHETVLSELIYPNICWNPALCLVDRRTDPLKVYEVQEVFGPLCSAFIGETVANRVRKLIVTHFDRTLFYFNLVVHLFSGSFRMFDDVLIALPDMPVPGVNSRHKGGALMKEKFGEFVGFVTEDSLFHLVVEALCDHREKEDAFRFNVDKAVEGLAQRIAPLPHKRAGVEVLAAYVPQDIVMAVIARVGSVTSLSLNAPVYIPSMDVTDGPSKEQLAAEKRNKAFLVNKYKTASNQKAGNTHQGSNNNNSTGRSSSGSGRGRAGGQRGLAEYGYRQE